MGPSERMGRSEASPSNIYERPGGWGAGSQDVLRCVLSFWIHFDGMGGGELGSGVRVGRWVGGGRA